MTDTIIYEQPLNEVIRACLRLEHLFNRIDHQLQDMSTPGVRNIVHLIIDALQLLDRPDLKAKLAKELSHHLSNLMRFGNLPEIDSEKLNSLTKQLEDLSRILIDSSGKIGYKLRDIELLNMLRMHLASPGGGCSFDIPLYHYWLQQPLSVHQAIINDWLNHFSEIRLAYSLILDLVRKSAKVEEKTAVHGFYQELLDPQSNLRMIRVGIPRSIEALPEISVGRHFLSTRFYFPDIEKRPAQFTNDVNFHLYYCST